MSVNSPELEIKILPGHKFLNDYAENRYDAALVDAYKQSGDNQFGYDVSHNMNNMHINASHDQLHSHVPNWPQYEPEHIQKIQFDFEFDLWNNDAHQPAVVVWDERDIAEVISRNESLRNKDLSKAVVTEARVIGKTINKNSPCSLKLQDKNQNKLYDTIASKSSKDGILREHGFPMYALPKEGTILKRNNIITNDIRRYGKINMNQITQNIVKLTYPPDVPGGPVVSYVFVPKHPNGAFFVWALEVMNNEVEGLLTNPLFQDPNKSEYFRIPEPLYDAVVKAFQNKINKEVNFHDLRRLYATLEPLKPFKDTGSERITIELSCYVPDAEDKNIQINNLHLAPEKNENINDYRQLLQMANDN